MFVHGFDIFMLYQLEDKVNVITEIISSDSRASYGHWNEADGISIVNIALIQIVSTVLKSIILLPFVLPFIIWNWTVILYIQLIDRSLSSSSSSISQIIFIYIQGRIYQTQSTTLTFNLFIFFFIIKNYYYILYTVYMPILYKQINTIRPLFVPSSSLFTRLKRH